MQSPPSALLAARDREAGASNRVCEMIREAAKQSSVHHRDRRRSEGI